jgi:hypothetical protein
MGKSIGKDEYDRAKATMKACRTKTCPNAGAKADDEGAEFCGICKGARKVAKEYERTHK